MNKILLIAGARPNFVKIAPLHRALSQLCPKIQTKIVHTGQHYDVKMSDAFFEDLQIPKPDIFLEIGSDTHAKQTARIMMAFEDCVKKEAPTAVVVVGDVNSTLACALVCAKLYIPVFHVEAGLRSHDRQMPEEINRILTDQLSDRLYVSEPSGIEHLKKEGIDPKKVVFVGNAMIDTLVHELPRIRRMKLELPRLTHENFAVLTLHRPSNVDSLDNHRKVLHFLKELTTRMDVIYPMHPRTRQKIQEFKLWDEFKNISGLHLYEPLGYLRFVRLLMECQVVITDSGGIQEETTYLNIPCLTMRENTERPITLTHGTNKLVGQNFDQVLRHLPRILRKEWPKAKRIRYWDGKAAERFAKDLQKLRIC